MSFGRCPRSTGAAGCFCVAISLTTLITFVLLYILPHGQQHSKPCLLVLNPNPPLPPPPPPPLPPPPPPPAAAADAQPQPRTPFLATLLHQQPPRLPYIVQRFQAGALTEDEWLLDPRSTPIASEPGAWWTGAAFKAHDFGALTDYTVCTQLQMKCALHASRPACLGDGFCAWCGDKQICLDRHLALPGTDFCSETNLELAPPPAGTPDLVHLISGGRTRTFNSSEIPAGGAAELQQLGCKAVVPGRFEMPILQNERMFYHWLFDLWPTLALQDDRLVHYILPDYATDMFSYFGLLSDNCWRLQASLPDGTCLATWPDTPRRPPSDGAGGDAFALVLRRMGPAPPRPARPLVTIIQRRAKRFLLNAETQLLPATRALGVNAVVADFEALTLHEQLQLLSATTVLVGLHGSGIANFVFLPRGAGVLEVYQFKSAEYAYMYYSHRMKFAGMAYKPMEISDPADHVFHWQHYKSDVKTAQERQAVVERGPRTAADFFTFWINTDTRLKVQNYLGALKELINAAPIHVEMGFRV